MPEKTYVEEYNAVLETLAKYIEGCAKADSSIMRPAFHADAVMFTTADSAVTRVPAHNALFDGIDNDFKPSNPNSAVVTVDLVGDVASARIDTDDLDGFSFTDFFHLLKAGGEWKIVAKTFYTHSTPAS
ncbi:nuclear transport factor 2 family protein [Rhodococcus sp. IEGM 1409]|uniref:nuclear transport factor 2 family protein n=1 Tax=Rhodococcus sp. IEGM 1409 TaxID=3047082 RepID=UPI0024B799B3|nr:nuclear transport factor 2 family protein [Rhodococcus sp. IEGM 1409]MDI9900494.1 nuclear transport factor 2 family protein [Rhodococcus sp. IEGM 1409]